MVENREMIQNKSTIQYKRQDCMLIHSAMAMFQHAHFELVWAMCESVEMKSQEKALAPNLIRIH